MSAGHTFIKSLFIAHADAAHCPSQSAMAQWFDDVLGLLFPERSEVRYASEEEVGRAAEDLKTRLREVICGCGCADDAVGRAEAFFSDLPAIRDALLNDAEAIYQGDPAARSRSEVVRAYPGFYATAAYRMAHVLLAADVPLLPRTIAEHAHRLTGIDIHPGATIGHHFCIDHGTGVVIGETTVIGNRVKIYQGVTLGALSVENREVSDKRHPTIEDGVVIYAGATILGGATVVGAGSVVGGNVWLTRSIPPGTKVYYSARMTNEAGELDTIILRT